MRKYVRDARSPVPSNEVISLVMSANKAKDTKPEISLRKALWKNNLKGYRLNYKKVPGRPDIVFVGKRVAIFINGCYWHRCPQCNLPIPKSNIEFWKDKFEKNIERDKRKIGELQNMGWKVLVVWECDLKVNMESQIAKILRIL